MPHAFSGRCNAHGITAAGTAGTQTDAATGSASASGGAEPPIITINGNNPATVNVGDIYADLGAMISSPASDKNLGITVLVDNATSTDGSVTIDASAPGQHTIEYRAYDQSGLMGSATRTVIVSAANDNTPPPVDASTTPPAANDNNATTSAATSTGTI